MTLTFNTHKLAQHVVCIDQLSGHRLQNFLKNSMFSLFSLKSLCNQNWPCRKIVQGQHKVMIYINYGVQESPMLHTEFR